MDNLKAAQLTGSKWRVLAIPFGGPFKGGKDLDGEYFDARTDIKPHWFKARPVLFHHGMDTAAKDEDYGEQELDDEPSADGWWSTVWLNRSARYWAEVDKLLRAGKAFGSSGAIAHLVRKGRDGHIDVWPHAEQTITPTPINFYARITASKALAGFDNAGIAIDAPARDVIAELDGLLPAASLGASLDGAPSGHGPATSEAARLIDRIDRLVIATRAIR